MPRDLSTRWELQLCVQAVSGPMAQVACLVLQNNFGTTRSRGSDILLVYLDQIQAEVTFVYGSQIQDASAPEHQFEI